jgi:asparagine synthase (glutamine-hydrolysing)
MTGRFISLLWDNHSSTQADSARVFMSRIAVRCPHLLKIVQRDGFAFYCSNGDVERGAVSVLPNDHGIVVGALFERSSDPLSDAPCRKATIGEAEAQEVAKSGGRLLLTKYWGQYIAFIASEGSRTHWILRSPHCHQPCLYSTVDGVRINFSSTVDVAALDFFRPSICWEFVISYLLSGRAHCRETGIREILELQCGEFQKITSQSQSTGFYWDPTEVAQLDAVTDKEFARDALRAAVVSCVSTWAGQHGHIVHRLSGGIDSSIVAACLRLAPAQPGVTCVNYYSPDIYGDERQHARAVAKRNGFRLVEYPQDTAYSLRKFLDFPRTESPRAYLCKLDNEAREVALASDVGATARFTGIMGDILFQMPPMLPAAVEYVQRRGVDWRFLQIAFQAAQLDRVSFWTVLKDSLRSGLFDRPRSQVPGEFSEERLSVLSRESKESYLADPNRFFHLWLSSLRGVPFGKFAQISCLGFNSSYFNSLQNSGESQRIHPFLSEPLTELCLRIPTYLMVQGGWDRALAREAFAPELPEIVRNRVSKGAMIGLVRGMLDHNLEFMRDFLADGALVKNGVIDRKQLMACFPGSANKNEVPMGFLIDCVSVEAWVQAWARGEVRYEAA